MNLQGTCFFYLIKGPFKGLGVFFFQVTFFLGGLPGLDNTPSHRPPQPPSQGCGKEALVLINKGTRCFAREFHPDKVPHPC